MVRSQFKDRTKLERTSCMGGWLTNGVSQSVLIGKFAQSSFYFCLRSKLSSNLNRTFPVNGRKTGLRRGILSLFGGLNTTFGSFKGNLARSERGRKGRASQWGWSISYRYAIHLVSVWKGFKKHDGFKWFWDRLWLFVSEALNQPIRWTFKHFSF